MVASFSGSTMKQYNSVFKQWGSFCIEKNKDPFDVSVTSVIQFLTLKYNDGASYGTINTMRSALSALSGTDVGKNSMICRFMAGIFKLRPSFPRYQTTWDVNKVLTTLESWFPLSDLNFKDLTLKTVMLLALTTAHRAQTFASVKLSDIHETVSGITITITEIIKTSAPGKEQPLLVLPYFSPNPSLCVASHIKEYIRRSEEFRNQAKKLFISFKKPYVEICSQTISRWLKTTLSKSGIDISIFKGHSTRHASTSSALSSGVNIETIRKTAGWTKDSEVFAKFYNRLVVKDGCQFAISILNKRR